MFEVLNDHAFPFPRSLSAAGEVTGETERFTIPMPALLAKWVALFDVIPVDNRDTKCEPPQ